MIQFLFAPQNLPFLGALLVMLVIAFIEGSLGLGDFEIPGPFGELCSWMRVGRVPMLAMFVIFLFIFGIGGYLIQRIAYSTVGLLPAGSASLLSAIAAIPLTRMQSSLVARMVPKDETSAINRNTLIGRVAKITLGKAKKGYPAQGKVKDQHGKTHYFLIEPDEDEIFEEGQAVLLVKYDGTKFYAIQATKTLIN